MVLLNRAFLWVAIQYGSVVLGARLGQRGFLLYSNTSITQVTIETINVLSPGPAASSTAPKPMFILTDGQIPAQSTNTDSLKSDDSEPFYSVFSDATQTTSKLLLPPNTPLDWKSLPFVGTIVTEITASLTRPRSPSASGGILDGPGLSSAIISTDATTTETSTSTFPTATPINGIYTNSSTTIMSNSTNTTIKTITNDDFEESTTPTMVPTYTLFDSTSCTELEPEETVTIWSILPNTTTTTVTVTPNMTTTFFSTPEWTPPAYCLEETETRSKESMRTGSISWGFLPPGPITLSTTTTTDSKGLSSTIVYWGPAFTSPDATDSRPTTTAITTSKNGVTETTTASIPLYPNASDKSDKVEATHHSDIWSPLSAPPVPTDNVPIPITYYYNSDHEASSPITQVVDGITVVVSPSQVLIGHQVLPIGPATQVVTEGGDIFTVMPDQVIGPSFVIYVPTYTNTGGGVFINTPTPTPTPVTTPAAPIITPPPQQVTSKAQVGQAEQPPSTNFVVRDGTVISAIGSTLAVIGDKTVTFGPGTIPQTTFVDGEAVTIGPSGIEFHGTTLGGVAHQTGPRTAVIGGLSITEIGTTIAIIAGKTFTIGPDAKPTTTVLNGHSISAGPDGLSQDGYTWYPFVRSTQGITAGGITFTEVGSSLAVIGGKTFTFGPGATPTTTIYNGQTISIGPGGVGFRTTTFTASVTSTNTALTGSSAGALSVGASAKSTSKKSGGESIRPVYGVLGSCILGWIGYLI